MAAQQVIEAFPTKIFFGKKDSQSTWLKSVVEA
jgi:hypothetical protein